MGKDYNFIDGLYCTSYDQGGITLQSWEARLTIDGEEYLKNLKDSEKTKWSKILNGIRGITKEVFLGVLISVITALIVGYFQMKK